MTEVTNKRKKLHKLIDNRKDVGATKSSIARQIMVQHNGQKTYKEFVDEIEAQTKLSRMICARYLKKFATRLPDFKTSDGKI